MTFLPELPLDSRFKSRVWNPTFDMLIITSLHSYITSIYFHSSAKKGHIILKLGRKLDFHKWSDNKSRRVRSTDRADVGVLALVDVLAVVGDAVAALAGRAVARERARRVHAAPALAQPRHRRALVYVLRDLNFGY